jgi:16S rRNA (uracil1498-N3)-methyltransferase
MHHNLFFVHPEDVSENGLVFRGDENRHLVRVMRKKTGDKVTAVDGRGKAYDVRILKTGQRETTAGIVRVHDRPGEWEVEVTLAQGLIKGSRFDWLVEKASEMGVRRIVPVRTANSVLKTLAANRVSRLKKIALSAMKQSGRSFLPDITPVTSFDALLESSSEYDVRFIAHPVPRGGSGIPVHPGRRVLCLVGPEGGFESVEVEKAVGSGFRPVSLGPSRLRAETAGIVLLTRVMAQYSQGAEKP